MTHYKLCGVTHSETEDDEAFQAVLARHYHAFRSERPLCLCQTPGLSLYIARQGERYVLKRWPNTGARHRYTCPRYEPPIESSGLMSLMGSAIKEEPHTGVTTLTVDFSLKRMKRPEVDRRIPPEPGTEAEDKGTGGALDNRRLTLKSILHLLWDRSGFSRWTPGLSDRRNWGVVSRSLCDTAHGLQIRHQPLAQVLYIPPLWNQIDADRQRAQRNSFFAGFQARREPRRLVIVLAEVKSLEPSQYGHRLTLKSMNDTRIYLEERTLGTLMQRYGFEVDAWSQNREEGERAASGPRLIVILTAIVSESGALQVEDLAAMLVSPQWVPYLSSADGLVVDTAVALKRHFLKPLTYNLGRGRTLPSVILIDTQPQPVNLFIKTATDSDSICRSREEMIDAVGGRCVIWDTSGAVDIYETLKAQVSTV